MAVQLLDERARPSPRPSAAATVSYLRGLRPGVGRAVASRQQLVRQFGPLTELVRYGDTEGFGEEADAAGRAASAELRFVRAEMAARPAPTACEACHQAALTWIDMLIAAADALAEIGKLREPARLREVQALLAEARVFSNRFRAQYETLVVQLKTQPPAKPTRPAIARLLPFGRPR